MRLAHFCLFVLAAACAPVDDASFAPSGDAHVTMRQPADGPWKVTFELKKPTRALDLGPTIDGHRAAHWRAEHAGVSIVSRNGRDFAVAKKRFSALTFLIEPVAADRRKAYAPFTPIGAGALIYTGEFTPFREEGVRMQTTFTFLAKEGASVIAFDENAPRLDLWESPYRHPAFVYAGEAGPRDDGGLISVLDPAAPAWIDAELHAFAPMFLEAYRALFSRSPPTRLNIFLAMGARDDAGRLAYKGDALPGQIQMTLAGGGWDSRSPEALAVLRLSTAHEAAHLWQHAARPASEAVPQWIHEGGADALAAEAMVLAGLWTPAQAAENLRRAAGRCAAGLERQSLDRVEAEKRWETVYACGHVLTVAAAGDGGASSFWREFVNRAGRNGYDTTLFLDLARERAGTDNVDRMVRLIRINNAQPHALIDQLLSPTDLGLAVSEGD